MCMCVWSPKFVMFAWITFRISRVSPVKERQNCNCSRYSSVEAVEEQLVTLEKVALQLPT